MLLNRSNMSEGTFILCIIKLDKKVLLCERKRHTARRVASTSYVVLTGYLSWQGTPPAGYHPRQGTPQQGTPRTGYPHQATLLAGYPPGWTWQGTPSPSWTWQGTPPGCPMAFWVMLQSIMGYGYPPCEQKDRHVSKHYLPVVLRTRAVKIL